ncbi:MAG: glycoside hydrolase/phage tail family protein [Pseudomonadota bacterium]
MGEIVLSQVGGALGGALLPNGFSIFGQTLSGAALGQGLGALAGRAIDAAQLTPTESPRIKSLHLMESREGAGLPLVFGRMRVAGQVIWASRFREKRRERSAGKGGPKYIDYTYSVSFAVALCQGPITRVDRVWANGQEIALDDLNWRLYPGNETQLSDPLIEAIEGAEQAPAYRGTAYIVFEDLPLDPYGNRLPQLSFEVVRAGTRSDAGLVDAITGVNIIPASGEFVYATSIVKERRFPGIERPINMNNSRGTADFLVSLDQLQSDLPNVADVALTVSWFGDDLRAGQCRLRPGVERRDRPTVPYAWEVGGIRRGGAYLISQTDGRPNFGGTPADQAVLEGIAALKAAGKRVTLSPFLMMDIPTNNGLPDLYGGGEQAAFPWRGRITVGADKTAEARADIAAFVGSDGGFGFRHFILHHARLARAANGVDTFLIGSEMSALTQVRDDQGRFPFVDALIDIAREAKAILGSETKVSYAANWTEYGAFAPGDGSNDILFPLDPLWASDAIDFVGIDWYPPGGDWRDGLDHADARAGYSGNDARDYIEHNQTGGEAYDWYYASTAARDAQTRTPIKDTGYGEDWIFRAKDVRNWWRAHHYERPGGTRRQTPTEWQPQSKPIRFIEIGFPAVDKGTNAPNVFIDPKSSESALPNYSSGVRDDLIQRWALAISVPFWRSQPEIEQVLVWAWDARPWPDFPARESVWSDGPNWFVGHWLNGRTGLIELSEVVETLAKDADVNLEAESLNGVVEGYAVDGITSLASALQPMITAYNFAIRETDGQLTAIDQTQVIEMDLEGLPTVNEGVEETWPLLDKQPAGVSLSYISSDFQYRPALVETRSPSADRTFIVRSALPMVLGEGQARLIAENLFAQTQQVQSLRLSLPPGASAALEIADPVAYRDRAWQITRIERDGLVQHLELSAHPPFQAQLRSVSPPQLAGPATVFASPELVLIASAALQSPPEPGVWIAVTSDPWPGAVAVKSGPDPVVLRMAAVVNEPAGIGQLSAPLATGPSDTWDETNTITLEMPFGRLESAPEQSVLAGANRLLVETSAGWELIGWQTAELIAVDRWRLSRLRRGLNGSVIASAPLGARCVLADDRLIHAPIAPELWQIEQFWQAGDAAPMPFTFAP